MASITEQLRILADTYLQYNGNIKFRDAQTKLETDAGFIGDQIAALSASLLDDGVINQDDVTSGRLEKAVGNKDYYGTVVGDFCLSTTSHARNRNCYVSAVF